MFGYVRIDKDELKVKDYNLFKAYYCGVCQTIKREYGFPARYFLSYDAAFLAVLLTAVREQQPGFSPVRCLANPLIRRPAAQPDPCFSYAAAVNVLLLWFKLQDDWADNRSVRAALLMPLMLGKKRKAQKRYPALYQKIESNLLALAALEKAKCPEPDAAAAAFGRLMADIFDTELVSDADKRRVLAHTGQLLGRFIYLLDAWEDRAADEKKQSYNPFLLSDSLSSEDSKLSLEYTLSELANTLLLLEPVRNRAIIENVMYLGLKKVLDSVFSGQQYSAGGGAKEKNHERPL